MSGPNDSGAGDTPTGDLKAPASVAAAPLTLSPRFRLQMHWEPPHLEWRPITTAAAPPAFLTLDDPLAALLDAERYLQSGSFLFDMRRFNHDLIDNAFQTAPTIQTDLLPSFAQMKAWEDDAFYRRLGRSAPLFGAPAPPPPLLTPPVIAAAAGRAVLQAAEPHRDANGCGGPEGGLSRRRAEGGDGAEGRAGPSEPHER